MTTFTAGRFAAKCYLGATGGEATTIVELHRNGSGEEMARLSVDKRDLPDLMHVLQRAIAAHRGGANG